jgi:Tfp pilus assembly protein PilX
MNPRLKLALIRHTGEQGFASVIAVGVGLVLMIIGLTMALRSQSDVALSSTQKSTSRALSAAEVGVTRYQQLINKNRQIVSYPDCISRSNLNANGNCSDSNSGTIIDKKLVSWYNISNYKGFNTCSNTGTSGSDISSQSGTQWRDIDPPTVTPVYSGDISKGQYRLVSYSYQENVDDPSKVPAGTVIGTGTLTVEGRVNVTGTGQSAKTTVSTSTAQLKVQIPVTKSIGSLPPGLWTTGTVIDGNQTVDGDIYLQCGATKPTNNITSGKTIQNTSQPVPSTPSLPTTEYLDLSATDINADLTLGSTTTSSSGNGGNEVVTSYTVTPTTNTNPLGAGLYVYKINNITGGTITIPPDQKVRIFLTGSISKGVSIVHNCPSG